MAGKEELACVIQRYCVREAVKQSEYFDNFSYLYIVNIKQIKSYTLCTNCSYRFLLKYSRLFY